MFVNDVSCLHPANAYACTIESVDPLDRPTATSLRPVFAKALTPMFFIDSFFAMPGVRGANEVRDVQSMNAKSSMLYMLAPPVTADRLVHLSKHDD